MEKVLFTAGGDMRLIYAAKKLSEKFSVYLTGFDNNVSVPDNLKRTDIMTFPPHSADYLLLPMPVTTDGIMLSAPFSKNSIPVERVLSVLKENGIVFGGKADEKTRKIFESSGILFTDYLEREEFSVLNAVPTAEGALQIALEEMSSTLYGSHVLITGYGRISKILSRMLLSLGADVTVAARKCSDLAWGEINGCKSVKISCIENTASKSDLIINTVPDLIFNKSILNKIKKGCLLLDLASKPGGVDFKAASESCVKFVWALGLPGKSAPVTAGEIIADTVMNILTERGLVYE